MTTPKKLYEITDQPLSLDDVAARVSRPNCGAITTFGGIVRGETVTEEGPRSTDFLAYEAYTEMAEQMLARIGDEIKQQWPKVEVVSIVHRTGRLEIGEPSVVIAVATPHRGDGCFEACRYAIERLKAIVPIWKQENWSDGAVWIEGPQQPELTAGSGAGLARSSNASRISGSGSTARSCPSPARRFHRAAAVAPGHAGCVWRADRR